ncbi:MAG: hypothetical protein FJ276_15125, partial [Planctomycetes bacterium]|nr:hypothetical protein [Planctomycetota bacterium]
MKRTHSFSIGIGYWVCLLCIVGPGQALAQPIPKLVLGSVTSSDGTPPLTNGLVFTAYISTRPVDQLTQESTGSGVASDGTSTFYFVDCSRFTNAPPWQVGEQLVVEMTNSMNGEFARESIVLTTNHPQASANIRLQSVPVPPQVTIQPPNLTLSQGDTVVFQAVVTTGTSPLSYQWRFMGTNLPGMTDSTLTLTNVQSGQAGAYQIEVTNPVGKATNTATLTVLVPPAILLPPAAQTAVVGANASFTVSVTGTPPMSYQWSKGGTPLADGGRISGAITADLTIASVTTNDAGSYAVTIANVAGATSSPPVSLTVNLVPLPPTIVLSPSNVAVTQGMTATFSMSASGTAPLSYLWRKESAPLTDGGRISGVATAALTITNVQYSDAGAYSVLVSNAVGTTSSAPATLTVLCSYALTTNAAQFGWAGGSGSVGVQTGGGCAWTVTGATNWVAITSPSSGSGTSTVAYVVQPNYTTNSRQALLVLAAKQFTVTQGAAPADQPIVQVIEPTTTNSFKTLFYRQVGLVEAIVRVANPSGAAQPALVLWIEGLPAGVKVWNATGTSNGVPY